MKTNEGTKKIATWTFPESVAALLDRPDTEQLTSDADFIQALGARRFLHQQVREARERCVGSVFTDDKHERQAARTLENLEAATALLYWLLTQICAGNNLKSMC